MPERKEGKRGRGEKESTERGREEERLEGGGEGVETSREKRGGGHRGVSFRL